MSGKLFFQIVILIIIAAIIGVAAKYAMWTYYPKGKIGLKQSVSAPRK